MSDPPEGILLVDKPEGPTSHDIVARIRRLTGQRRAGHTGTLDPMASGLLVVMLGRATRLARFLPHSPKRYTGTIRLGVATDSDDVTGEVVQRHAGTLPSPEEVVEAARALTGLRMQTPPAVSARKVGGERLYRLARRGRPVLAPAVEVHVERFDLEPAGAPGEWAFTASVSAGTYIRALARDLGAALGCGGALSSLRRVAIGPLDISAAVRLPSSGPVERSTLEERLVGLDDLPLVPPRVTLPEEQARRFTSGMPVPADSRVTAGEPRVVTGAAGELLGVAEIRDGRLHPRVVIRPAPPTGCVGG